MSLRRPKRNSWEHRALAKLRQQQSAVKAQLKPSPSKPMMISTPLISYSRQVIEATDADGMLSIQLAKQLMLDHSTSLFELERDGYQGNCRHAESLLEFLGY